MSGKQAKKKRREIAAKITKSSAEAARPKKPQLAKPASTLKLDLACGQNCAEGFEGVDLPGTRAKIASKLEALRATPSPDPKEIDRLVKAQASIKHEVNLLRFPWPWADSSVLEIHSSHFVEHIPTEFVDEQGNYVPCGTSGAKDLFFAFFDECHRVLVPDGWGTVIVPCLRNNRAFQDPTHRRFLPMETFFYLSRRFREENRLDHYNVRCNFDGKVDSIVMEEMNLRTSEVQTRMFTECWNAIIDWHVKIKAVK